MSDNHWFGCRAYVHGEPAEALEALIPHLRTIVVRAGLAVVAVFLGIDVPASRSTQASHMRSAFTRLADSSPHVTYIKLLGGLGHSSAYATAVDRRGDFYVTGASNDPLFPTRHAYQPFLAGGLCNAGAGVPPPKAPCTDAFVTKLDPTGRKILYSTYLGGSGPDWAASIAVDKVGNAYITGTTHSTDFPLREPSTSAAGKTPRGTAFVAKIGPHGKLLFSTRLAGGSGDAGAAIAADNAGNAYIAGSTASDDFPVTNGLQAAPPHPAGQPPLEHTFVMKIDTTTGRIVYSTYLDGSVSPLGGVPETQATGIALDSQSEPTVVGWTEAADFPVAHALQPVIGGLNVFVTKLNAQGNGLVFSTYLGGSMSRTFPQRGNGLEDDARVAVDPHGDISVVGQTYSTDFPTVHPLHPTLLNLKDGFATKLSPDGRVMRFSTYVVGPDVTNWVPAVATDAKGNTYILHHGDVLTKVNPDGTRQLYQIAVPAAGEPDAVAVTDRGSICLAGEKPTGTARPGVDPYLFGPSKALIVCLREQG